jgi:hypothetical protein
MKLDRIKELAGVPLTEMEKDSDDIYNTEEGIKKAADAFEQAVDRSGITQDDADEWADMLKEMMGMFHEELKQRGLYE